MTTTAEACVDTDRAGRYLVQLCRHAGQMRGAGGHLPRRHAAGMHAPRIEHVDWTDTDGVISVGWGRCLLRATEHTLTVRAEAADEQGLARLQALVGHRLEAIGRRDGLHVVWSTPHAPHHDHHPGGPVPGGGTGWNHTGSPVRSRFGTVLLVAGVVVAIAVHLGLGGAAFAGSTWATVPLGVVLAVVVVKLVVAAVALRRRRAR